MTINEKIAEIEEHFSYWVGSYQRRELATNNVRIVAESICKALILRHKTEPLGTMIILGKDPSCPKNRNRRFTGELKLFELIQVLDETSILKTAKTVKHQLEIVRDRTNPSSHSANKPGDDTTLDDLTVCNTNICSVLKWFYTHMAMSLPQIVTDALAGKSLVSSGPMPHEKWEEFYSACHHFDNRRFQYMLVSPENLPGEQYVPAAFVKMKWRLVIDFNAETDNNDSGLLYNFNAIVGQGYKKAYTLKDTIEFEPEFPHYWFLANGYGSTGTTSDYKSWRSQYKRFLSDKLYRAFNQGSRIKSRIVVLLNIPPLYAEDIIEEFNRIDEANLQFILCSETERYEAIFDKIDNVRLIQISPIDIANGINGLTDIGISDNSHMPIQIPLAKEDKKYFTEVSVDHFDYLHSLGIEVVYKGIEQVTESDTTNRFYKGSTITWRDLSEQKDVTRSLLETFQKRIEAKLIENRLDELQLIHDAGAGGTTVGRRVAYNFSTKFPTVILRKYHHRKTIDGLRIIYDHYTKGSLPLFIVLESYEVKDHHLLYSDLANAKKNALILVVHRGSNNHPKKNLYIRAQLEANEVYAFENAYTQLAPLQKEKLLGIPKLYRPQPKYISPVLYALTAFGKDYDGLESYVAKCVDGITLEQRKLAGFVCLVYYYTQKSIPAELFSSLFNVDRSKCDLVGLLGSENPILELLHQESNDDDYLNLWRPRYALLGEEAMKVLLGGDVKYKNNWRTQLATWLNEFIHYVKESMPYLDDETLDIFNALFIERNSSEDTAQGKDFTKAIGDLPSPTDGIAIFESLTAAYPDEAHFHGHFARYLYSGKIGVKDFDRAIEEAEEALRIVPDNSSCMHTLGMCYREKAEALIYNFKDNPTESEVAEAEVKDLTEKACRIFDDCIEIDPYNIYGYESQIRVILKTLDFGFRSHNAYSKETFITNPLNNWYLEKLDKVSNLLEDALYVIEQTRRLENRERVAKSAGYVYDCEALFFKTLGRNLTAKNKFEDLIKNTPRNNENMRPHYRRMYIMCLLASKSSNEKDLFQAWGKISENELLQCIQYLEDNIFEDPNNTQNMRLWVQAIRHLKTPPSLVSCLSKVSAWTQVIDQNTNSLIEGYYYLYVLNAINAISSGSGFDPSSVQNVKDVQEKMKPFFKNEKFCFEWFGTGKGIQQMLNHRRLGEFTPDFFEKNRQILTEVKGRITSIHSSQQGTIELDCGLSAFFVPNIGGFTERNINDKVKFFVGFRYDQIQAWSVLLEGTDREKFNKSNGFQEVKEFIEEGVELEEERTVHVVEPTSEVLTVGPKVIGKIDLSQFDRKKKEK